MSSSHVPVTTNQLISWKITIFFRFASVKSSLKCKWITGMWWSGSMDKRKNSSVSSCEDITGTLQCWVLDLEHPYNKHMVIWWYGDMCLVKHPHLGEQNRRKPLLAIACLDTFGCFWNSTCMSLPQLCQLWRLLHSVLCQCLVHVQWLPKPFPGIATWHPSFACSLAKFPKQTLHRAISRLVLFQVFQTDLSCQDIPEYRGTRTYWHIDMTSD